MVTPKSSGIYLVTLTNEVPTSVNADRPDISERCIKVNKKNCKVGRAENLARREVDYRKTFGSANVSFEILFIIDRPETLEGNILSRLHHYRIKGKAGHLNEWLEGITPKEVKRIVYEVIESQSQLRVSKSKQGVNPSVPMDEGHLDATDPKETIRLLRSLSVRGFSDSHFAMVHHKRGETINGHLKYCERKGVFRLHSNNGKVQLRLRFIDGKLEQGHFLGVQVSSNIFDSLSKQAVVLFPKA